MWQDFKKFALKGNVVDLAVAVIIGGAFNKIVKSLVDNIIMPLVGTLLGGVSFENLKVTVKEAEISYGLFIQNIVDFLIIAFSVFIFVKVYKKLERKEEQAALKKETQEDLLRQIRDLLSQAKT
jgi:large conductance mechanosensitive channel